MCAEDVSSAVTLTMCPVPVVLSVDFSDGQDKVKVPDYHNCKSPVTAYPSDGGDDRADWWLILHVCSNEMESYSTPFFGKFSCYRLLGTSLVS